VLDIWKDSKEFLDTSGNNLMLDSVLGLVSPRMKISLKSDKFRLTLVEKGVERRSLMTVGGSQKSKQELSTGRREMAVSVTRRVRGQTYTVLPWLIVR
jgi:hypothetical protein